MPEDKIGGIRQFLQDVIAPSIGVLSEKITTLSNDCLRLGESIKDNQVEIKDIWKTLGNLEKSVARMEGRADNIKEEIAAKMMLEMAKWSQVRTPPPASLLPDPTESEKPKP